VANAAWAVFCDPGRLGAALASVKGKRRSHEPVNPAP
jgi:hypothetical protein